MGLFSWIEAIFGRPALPDAQAEQLRDERSERQASGVIAPRADLEVARRLATAGHAAAALEDLRAELDLVEKLTRQEFPQCTAAEQRDLAAMRRSEIYGACTLAVRGSPAEAVYALVAHAWWICGLVGAGDRGQELRLARRRERWGEQTSALRDLPALVDMAFAFKPLRTATDVEQLAAQLWAHAGLPDRDRLRA